MASFVVVGEDVKEVELEKETETANVTPVSPATLATNVLLDFFKTLPTVKS
jgi:hypothetical protein